MTNDKWIEFEGRRSANDAAEPRVTIQRGGSLGLNLPAYRLLGEPTHVVYVADGSGLRFGIKPATGEAPHSYPVRAQSGGRSFVLGAKSFLKWAKIPFGGEARYCGLHMEDGIGVVELTPKLVNETSKSAGRGKS